MSDELRDRIAAVILDNFNPPDDRHSSWWIAPKVSAQAVIDGLELTAHEVDRGNATKYVTKWLYP